MTAGFVVNIVVISINSGNPDDISQECRTNSRPGEFMRYEKSIH